MRQSCLGHTSFAAFPCRPTAHPSASVADVLSHMSITSFASRPRCWQSCRITRQIRLKWLFVSWPQQQTASSRKRQPGESERRSDFSGKCTFDIAVEFGPFHGRPQLARPGFATAVASYGGHAFRAVDARPQAADPRDVPKTGSSERLDQNGANADPQLHWLDVCRGVGRTTPRFTPRTGRGWKTVTRQSSGRRGMVCQFIAATQAHTHTRCARRALHD